MSRFDGKVVVITGGNSGIGLAAAQQFEAEGARVVVTGRDEAVRVPRRTFMLPRSRSHRFRRHCLSSKATII
jgi:NAD(P)-dependent dehydrogenase (short-subunit alcohol dehydrogenase family)